LFARGESEWGTGERKKGRGRTALSSRGEIPIFISTEIKITVWLMEGKRKRGGGKFIVM